MLLLFFAAPGEAPPFRPEPALRPVRPPAAARVAPALADPRGPRAASTARPE